ncbi:MAG: type VI secretion system baseplate subunit TssK [Xylophilus ampelinus]
MIRSSKILWGEGLMLRPQHFQRQDAYHEWRQADLARAMHPYSWGLRRLTVDLDALSTGGLRILDLQAILPDGEACLAPEADELPDALSLADIPAGVSEVVFHLALAPLRPAGGNSAASDEEARSGVRYRMRNEAAADWFTSAVQADIPVLRRRLRLVSDLEPCEHLVTLPLLRLHRQAVGGFALDARFLPPALSLAATPCLPALLRRLLDVLQAKVEALYGSHREPSRHVIEFRSGDVASFWLLHTCSSAFASLSHFHHHPLLHPERLFQRLLELAGALMTFSRSHGLADLPVYRHDQPGPAFEALDRIVRDLLETVISTRSFSIPVGEVRPSYYQARLESEKIDDRTRFYLGASAGLPPSELVEAIPLRLKVGAADDVEKMVLSAVAGVRLTHAPQVPVSIPVRPGHYYFAIEPRGALYERMLQSRLLAIYAPSGLPELHLELFALSGEP